MLEETDYLANWINQMPIKNGTALSNNKCYRKFDKPASKIILDHYLEQYFRKSIKTEYWECLKFNLAIQIKKYPSIKKPVDFEHKTINQVK